MGWLIVFSAASFCAETVETKYFAAGIVFTKTKNLCAEGEVVKQGVISSPLSQAQLKAMFMKQLKEHYPNGTSHIPILAGPGVAVVIYKYEMPEPGWDCKWVRLGIEYGKSVAEARGKVQVSGSQKYLGEVVVWPSE